ncbi:MAG: cytochrome C assembly protein [Pirellulales bacterium]|nr:cytochrome C assembly protein [Pirellulales bacterium]
MDLGVNMLCFTASYAIALVLEFLSLWAHLRWRRLALLAATSAGLVAHTWFLGQRVALTPRAPLATHQDWYLLAAWLLALIYLAAKLYYPKSSMGLFLLPAVLGLIAGAQAASNTQLATFQGPRLWGRVHGMFLMLGTVAVLLGFLAGLMYLIQSYRLKHKRATGTALRLPSLEWLERVNSRALAAATLLVGGGFFTGVMSRLVQSNQEPFIPWTDPVVMSLSAMLIWLVVAEVFRLIYPPARRGRKVAYQTVAAFAFLVFVLAVILLQDSLHLTRAVTEIMP